jgi:hypothetical protein
LVQGEEESGKSQVWGQLQVFGTDSRMRNSSDRYGTRVRES